MLTATLVVLVLLAVWFVSLYNSLIRGRNLVREGWSGIDAQLKRRYDLIPRLVESVKGYLSHERTLIEDISSQRTRAMSTTSVAEKGAAESALTTSLRSLFAVAEAYPDLKASVNMAEFQKALADTEDQIQLARRYYNGTVRDFNTRIESFPGNIVANMFSFRTAEFFQLDSEAERTAPEVKF